ncbi:MAG: hypothetical protein JOZ02_12630 [Acidobacteria bacterium]|nr:hypothetical protein [Acidobacteriota bacterium]
MGLALFVGVPSEIRESDPEYVAYFEQQVEAINGVLESFGLPPHHEPFDVEDERTFECEMLGYSGLHYLRRLAAHLALGKELPPPGDDGAASDPVLSDYYRIFDASFARGQAAGMPFQHLIVHGDAEGYYLPVEFEDVIIPDASLEIAGGMLGSSHALLRECRELAQALELPEDLSVEDERLWLAPDTQGAGETKWERYGVESFTCLRLIRACEASVGTGAAVVFA